MAFNFNGAVLYRDEDGGSRCARPLDVLGRLPLPVATWREMMDRHHPEGGWVRRPGRHASPPCAAGRPSGACRRSTLRWPSYWRSERVRAGLDTLVDSLLYEGYALYPYTPGATKNATPTPFGIVYPAGLRGRQPRHLRPRVGCEARARARCRRAPTLRFLHRGERHEAVARQVDAGAGRRAESPSATCAALELTAGDAGAPAGRECDRRRRRRARPARRLRHALLSVRPGGGAMRASSRRWRRGCEA